MTTEVLDRAVDLQKEYAELYRQTGLIAIEPNEIHLTNEEFFETFKPEEIKESPRSCKEYPYQYTAVYKDINFFCIAKERYKL